MTSIESLVKSETYKRNSEFFLVRKVQDNVPVKSKLEHRPPGRTPGIWRLFLPGREGIWSPFIGGGEFDH